MLNLGDAAVSGVVHPQHNSLGVAHLLEPTARTLQHRFRVPGRRARGWRLKPQNLVSHIGCHVAQEGKVSSWRSAARFSLILVTTCAMAVTSNMPARDTPA